jgi:hypothetical protein
MLDFDTMILTVEDYGSLDGEGMLQVDRKLSAAWSEKHERDGWTRAEWMRRSHTEQQVRRMPDGIWHVRLTHRQWAKAVALAGQALEESEFVAMAVGTDAEFNKLVGISWGLEERSEGAATRPQ